MVAATDNEARKVFWPGIGNGVVTVTPVDAEGNLGDNSVRRSSLVDFAAPGVKIAAGAWTPSGWRSDVLSDGASQATAITAGGLAAVWSAHPDATANQVLQTATRAVGVREDDGKFFTWFRRIGDNLPSGGDKTESYGFGIVAPADAVQLEVAGLPRTSPMVDERRGAEPSAAQIEAIAPTGSDGSQRPSPSRSHSGSAPERSDEEASAADTEDVRRSSNPWVVVGLIGAVALVVIGLAIRLRKRTRFDDG